MKPEYLSGLLKELLRESSFNMTRGGYEDIEGGGGGLKFLDTRKGGSENLYTLNPKGGGVLKNLFARGGGGGATKISSFEFQYLHPPPCHIK